MYYYILNNTHTHTYMPLGLHERRFSVDDDDVEIRTMMLHVHHLFQSHYYSPVIVAAVVLVLVVEVAFASLPIQTTCDSEPPVAFPMKRSQKKT